MHERKTIVGRARHAASLMKEVFDVAREVAEWRRERDAFVEMHQAEEHRRDARRAHETH
jgi:hypothetical protein